MFGGPCYWTGGNMFAAVHQESLLVRLGEKDRAELLAQPGAHLFEPMEGRPMKEYVVFPGDMLADRDGSARLDGQGAGLRREPAAQREEAAQEEEPEVAAAPPGAPRPDRSAALRRLTGRRVGLRRLDRHRRDAGEVADDVHELAVGRHDDLGVLPERLLDRLELAQHLGVADEVLLGGLVDQLDGLRLALGGEDLGLLDALGLLDLGAPLAVGLRLGGGGDSRWRRSSRSRP